MQILPAGVINILRLSKNLSKMRLSRKMLSVILGFMKVSKTILPPEFSIQSLHILGFMKNLNNDVTPTFIKHAKLGSDTNDKRGETLPF